MSRVSIASERIRARLGLGQGGRVVQALARETARLCDGYIPLRTGYLKNTHTIAADGSRITYTAGYAKKQYYRKTNQRAYPNRGPYWDKRMLADKRWELEQAVSRAIKGEAD